MTLLAGLRVLDFSRVMSGPFCTAMLADLGAEVIKVESPEGGDDSRAFGPFVNGASVYFALLNRNKSSIAIDLKSGAGREIAHALARESDVVVENFRPGVAARLAIDDAALRALNPRLVYLSISGFGDASPLRGWPAYDLVVQAMSGLMSTTGTPDGPPTAVGESIADVWTGLTGAWAILAALQARQRTGLGQHIDLAMFDALLGMQLTRLAELFATGIAPVRVGNRHPVTAPVDTFAARDGFITIVAPSDAHFAKVATLIGRPDIVGNALFLDNAARHANLPALKAIIETWTGERSAQEAARLLRDAGIPAGPVWDLAQACESEQAKARGLAQEIAHPLFGAMRYLTQPAKFSSVASVPPRPEPALGEHTDAVLAQVLGYSPERLAQLRAAGAIG